MKDPRLAAPPRSRQAMAAVKGIDRARPMHGPRAHARGFPLLPSGLAARVRCFDSYSHSNVPYASPQRTRIGMVASCNATISTVRETVEQ